MGENDARPLERLSADGGSRRDRNDRLVRLSINLNPDIADTLKEYAQRKGISITEAVRRAVSVLSFVDQSQESGSSVLVEQNGSLKEVVFMV